MASQLDKDWGRPRIRLASAPQEDVAQFQFNLRFSIRQKLVLSSTQMSVTHWRHPDGHFACPTQFVIRARPYATVLRGSGDIGGWRVSARLFGKARSGGHRLGGGMRAACFPGPEGWDITSGQSDPKNLVYGLVQITPRTVEVLAANDPQIVRAGVPRRGPETKFGFQHQRYSEHHDLQRSTPGGLFTPPRNPYFAPVTT